MTTYAFSDEELVALKGKTILVIGSATGIGRATVLLAHSHGANVAMGDWNHTAGQELADELGDRVMSRKCDVSEWSDVLNLFQEAFVCFGIIHAVLSNAGVSEDHLFKKELDPKTNLLRAPNLKPLEINLHGMLYAVRCAKYYFAKQPGQYQIVLTGSAASFLESPPLYLYSAAKVRLLGLMRALRTQLAKKNITVNIVCPWATETQMLAEQILSIWGDLPRNQAEGVGRALLLPVCRPQVNGKAFFIADNQIIDFEDKLERTRSQWQGEELRKAINEGQRRLIPWLIENN